MATEVLRTLQELLQPCLPLLDAVTDAVVITTWSGEIAWANASTEELFGHGVDEVVGASVRLLMPALAGDRPLEALARELTGKARRADGLAANYAFFDITCRCEVLQGSDGEAVVWFMAPVQVAAEREVERRVEAETRSIRALSESLHDETRSLRRAHVAARSGSEARTAFVAALAREMRAPLEAIGGLAEALSMEASAAEDRLLEHDTHKIARASQHLLTLLDDVGDMVGAESKALNLEYEVLSIPTFLREVAREGRSMAEAQRNTIEVRYTRTIDTLLVDAGRLRRVLLHLIGNACKWTWDGKVTVTVTTRVEGQSPTVLFEVADTGAGIAPERRESLFVPFAGYGRGSEEVGLGLCLSRSLCRLMGGELSLTSVEHEGSVFVVSLPLMVGAAHKGTASGARPARAAVVSRELHRRKQRDALDASLREMDSRHPQRARLDESGPPPPPSTHNRLARSVETPVTRSAQPRRARREDER